MIAGIFHKGSGLGNQLHRYVATRVLALNKGYEFSMVAPENFKGKGFMNLDMGKRVDWDFETESLSGKIVNISEKMGPEGSWIRGRRAEWEEKTPYYNPEFNFIEDNTIIDGEFQDERYFERHLDKVLEWLNVEPITMHHNTCVIGFRGGEFYTVPELGLPKSYYEEGIARTLEINPNMKFEVHTDDEVLAKQFFPRYPIIHDIGINWCSVLCAKYAIIANSSFYILPRLLGTGVTIAPRYWDRYNSKKWERPYNYYKQFTYI